MYLNFPISILKTCWSKDVKQCMNDIMDYAIYRSWTKSGQTFTNDSYKDYADKHFGIILGAPKKGFENGKSLYENTLQKTPFAGIDKNVMFDYYKNPKTEFDVLCLAAELALHSIIGEKPYIKTNFDMMAARMAGYNSHDRKVKYPTLIEQYMTKQYWRQKIIDDLMFQWNLSYYSARGIRGFYVSFRLNDETLIRTAELKRRSRITKELKKKMAETRRRVLEDLNKGHYLNKADTGELNKEDLPF